MLFQCVLVLIKKRMSCMHMCNYSIASVCTLFDVLRAAPTLFSTSPRHFQHLFPCKYLPLCSYSCHSVSFDLFVFIIIMLSSTPYSAHNHQRLFIITFIIIIYNSLKSCRMIFLLIISKWLHLNTHERKIMLPLPISLPHSEYSGK